MSEAEQGRVDALTHEGEGVVHGGKTVFVAGALPGESIRFRRVRRRKRHDEALLLEVLEPSVERVAPRCAHFGVCGGCALQHLNARCQIDAKHAELKDTLERVGRATPETWLEPSGVRSGPTAVAPGSGRDTCPRRVVWWLVFESACHPTWPPSSGARCSRPRRGS